MNTAATSRSDLLRAAKQIAAEQGIAKISIRAVAARCGVSVGAIYNYYRTKSDLILAVIEDFWMSALGVIPWNELEHGGFVHCFETVFFALSVSVSEFQHNWIGQLALLETDEKKLGREREADYFALICQVFANSLTCDEAISPDRWNGTFTVEAFARFAFESLIRLLQKNQTDCDFLIELFNRCLYSAE